MLISIETHITCDFLGGLSGPPIPPLHPHMLLLFIIEMDFQYFRQTISS